MNHPVTITRISRPSWTRRASHAPHMGRARAAARRAIASVKATDRPISHSTAWIVLTAGMMTFLAGLFGALVGASLH